VASDGVFELRVHCPASYPDTPPTVRFLAPVRLPCVDQSGEVSQGLTIMVFIGHGSEYKGTMRG
jgi:ubiquitin-protein ligase